MMEIVSGLFIRHEDFALRRQLQIYENLIPVITNDVLMAAQTM
jgi:hypothetical protein